MVFDRQKIIKKIDPGLKKLNGEIATNDYITANHANHNHNELAVDFGKTKFFKKIQSTLPLGLKSHDEARKIFEEVKQDLISVNEIIYTKQKYTKKQLNQILRGLAIHMCAKNKDTPEYFRFGICKWNGGWEYYLSQIETSFEVVNTIKANLNDPEVGGFHYKFWNKVTSSIWVCLYAGLYQEALYIINILEKLILKIYKKEVTNVVFYRVLDQGTNARFLMTLYMARTKVYVAQGKIDLAIKDYEQIVSYYRGPGVKPHPPLEIHWFTGLTRIVEASIEIYRLNPTEENKKRCIDLYLNSSGANLFDNTESTRERGLITYMLMKYVLNIEVK